MGDRGRPACEHALAISWLAHLVGDAHQPCHAGSQYAEVVFPEGDRGANSIPTIQGKNRHALWDRLLGSDFDAGDVKRRIRELTANPEFKQFTEDATSTPDTLNPERWLSESRLLSARSVYAREVLRVIWNAQQSGLTQLDPFSLLNELYGWFD